jgi:hypothetical protein
MSKWEEAIMTYSLTLDTGPATRLDALRLVWYVLFAILIIIHFLLLSLLLLVVYAPSTQVLERR